jgi:hypothetical protein
MDPPAFLPCGGHLTNKIAPPLLSARKLSARAGPVRCGAGSAGRETSLTTFVFLLYLCDERRRSVQKKMDMILAMAGTVATVVLAACAVIHSEVKN